jgi:hypothetical protein
MRVAINDALVGRVWGAQGHHSFLRRIAGQRLVARALVAIHPIGDLPALRASKRLLLLGVALTSVLAVRSIPIVFRFCALRAQKRNTKG